jgi:uncharacterized membrane protein YccC
MNSLLRLNLSRRVAMQRVLVSTLAVTCAWMLGSVLPWTDPIVAAILCTITLRISLQASVSEAFSQLIGVALGAGLALLAVGVTGHNMVTVALTVAFASAAARLLRLGDDGWINIAVTALIVLGPGDAERNAGARVWGTLLGVGVALVFAYWAHPSSPVGRTQKMISDAAGAIAELLADVAIGAGSGFDTPTAAAWLERARCLNDQVLAIRPQAEECVRYARWSPLASRAEAEGVFARYVSVEHTMVQVRNVVRSFYDASLQNIVFGRDVARAMHETIVAASDAVEAGSSAVLLDPLADHDPLPIAFLRDEVSYAMAHVRKGDDDALVLGASVVANMARIADSLDPTTPAIAEVPTPVLTSTPAGKLKEAITHTRAAKARRRRRDTKVPFQPDADDQGPAGV